MGREALTRSMEEVVTMPVFLDQTVDAYRELLESYSDHEESEVARASLLRLLSSPLEEPLPQSTEWNSPELAWRWRVERTRWQRTLTNRGDRYNGYPVSRGYVGSYALDGLAIALWAAYHTDSFDSALERCVNLQGDADSTAAICGTLCGAFYGASAINPRITAAIQRWDNGGDIALRGALLWYLGRSYDGRPPPPLEPLQGEDAVAVMECSKTTTEFVDAEDNNL